MAIAAVNRGTSQRGQWRAIWFTGAFALLALVATAGFAYAWLTSHFVYTGRHVIIGPHFTGQVPITAGCVCRVDRGKAWLPYCPGGPNGLTTMYCFVVIESRL